MSCCPLEITVATKPDTSAMAIALAQDFVLPHRVEFQTALSYSFEVVAPPVFHSGRDTLLKTRLLRI
jgi:hypothetical protein